MTTEWMTAREIDEPDQPKVSNERQSKVGRVAKCDQGYLCEVCGRDVPDIEGSDLYLRYVLGELQGGSLMASPERHLRCNPTLAQYIIDPGFQPPVEVAGPFDKRLLDPIEVKQTETRVTQGWKRLQEVRSLGIPISQYPLAKTP